MRNIYILLIGILFLSACQSTSNSKKAEKVTAQPFPFTQVPAMISNEAQKSEYAVKHFWNDYFVLAQKSCRDTLLVGGVGKDSFTKAFTTYISLLEVTSPETIKIAQDSLLTKAERIEIVHRSGTFNETHPAGDHVTKVKKTHYHFVQDHYLAYSGKDMQLSAGGILGAMGEIVNITAKENLNRDAKKMNANITEDINTKVGRNIFMKVEGDILQLHINNEVQIICKDLVNLICEDDLLINGEKDIKIAAKGNLHLEGATSVGLISPAIVSTLTPYTALGGAVGGAIRSLSTLSMGLGPDPYSPPELVDANADFDLDRFINDEDPVIDPSTIKPGFVLDGPGGDLWKPISDTKPFAVSLSLSMSPHELYEAVPTGELEEAVIQYMKADGSIISWTVIRPKHKTGRMIERARFNGVANGGRAHWVWSKKGSDYPQQMFLKIGSTEWLLVMASVRHD